MTGVFHDTQAGEVTETWSMSSSVLLQTESIDLAPAANAYDYSVATGAEAFLGPEKMAEIDAVAESEVAGLTDEPAWPVLRGHLAIAGAHGRGPVEALRTAVRFRELGTALTQMQEQADRQRPGVCGQ